METEFALSLGSQRWTLPTDGDTVTIGRGSIADIRLPSDDQISRIHARLDRSGSTWTLVDESRNGTALNGRRLAAPTPLTNNDRIHIGRSVLTFHEPTSRSTPASTDPAAAPASQPPGVPVAPPAAAGGPAPGGTPGPTPTPGSPPAFPPAAAASGADLSSAAPSPVPPTPAAPGAPPVPPPAAPPAHTPPGVGGTSPAPARPDASSPASPGGRPAGDAPAPSPQAPPAQTGHGGMPPQGADPTTPQGGAMSPGTLPPGGAVDPSAQYKAGGTQGAPGHPGATGTPPHGPTGAPEPPPQTDPSTPQGGVVDPSARYRAVGSSDARGASASAEAGGASAQSGGVAGDGASYGGSGGGPAFWDDLAGEVGPRDEWVDEAPVGWVEVEESGPGGDAAWAAYPSADNPEPARSPWSEGQRPALVRPEGGPANWSESAGWPDSAFDQQQPPPAPAPTQPEPVRRTPAPATGESAVGRVRLVRVLLIAAAVLGLGLIINMAATFFADGPGGSLRWLVPPTIALIAAMVVALLDAIASEERPRAGRVDVPVLVAIGAVLLGVGVGGFALTAGVEYAAAYVTGKESGEDRLIKPVARTGSGVTVTVENVTYTSHFTRVEVAVSNGSDQPLRLPLDGQAAFTGPDGNSLKPDGFRSQWPNTVAAGAVEHGTITFTGHLPDDLTTATLTLRSGDPAIAVPGLALSN
ncbi:FHA domain-containing protein [Kribbella sp. NPDC050124]|uniref:FHA domain-containing protein n=1 Tax=Kribbella sp. NPDC050124 TaxID=3364114 RepID=UPI0037918367